MNLKFKQSALSLATLLLLSTPYANADENLLGYTLGAETIPKGTSEAYMWLTHKDGKRRGDYARQEMRMEYEYGLRNDLSVAAYLNGYRHDYNCGDGCAGPVGAEEISGSLNQTRLSGFSLEAKKMLFSPYKDDLGVALYGEVTYDSIDSITGEHGNGFELETKVIFQKPYMDGQMQWVSNLEVEAESWQPKGGQSEYAVAPRLRTGLSYRFTENWNIGIEGWADLEILNPATDAWEFDHWDAFAGPSLHYANKSWWATVTAVTQVAGSNEADGNSTGRHLADHEKNELRIKLGYNF